LKYCGILVLLLDEVVLVLMSLSLSLSLSWLMIKRP